MDNFDDNIIIKNIISDNPCEFILADFFKDVREYSKNYWISKYPNLKSNEWEDILSQVDFVFIKRIKKGLTMYKSKLSSYYTLITKYAILDYLTKYKNRNETEIDDIAYTLGELAGFDTNIDNEQKSAFLREKLEKFVKNTEQLKVALLFFDGYSYREILERTNYKSETACRNAVVKCKNKIKQALQNDKHQYTLIKDILN